MPCLQLQVVTLHVLCGCAKPRPSLNLILAPQCRTPKPVDDTTDDLLSLAGCSETGVTVATLLLYFDDFLCHAVKPHWLKPTRNFFFFAWVKKWSGQNQAAQTASASPVTCCFAASAAQNRVMPLILWASNTTTRFRSKTSNFCNFTPEYTRNDLRSFSGGGMPPDPPSKRVTHTLIAYWNPPFQNSRSATVIYNLGVAWGRGYSMSSWNIQPYAWLLYNAQFKIKDLLWAC